MKSNRKKEEFQFPQSLKMNYFDKLFGTQIMIFFVCVNKLTTKNDKFWITNLYKNYEFNNTLSTFCTEKKWEKLST